MATKIQLRRDTAANWTTNNPTLAAGEVGVETDTSKIKIGNGTDNWVALSYFGGGGDFLPLALTEATSIVAGDNPFSIVTNPLTDVGTKSVLVVSFPDEETFNVTAVNAAGDAINSFAISPTNTDVYLFSPNGTKYQLVVGDDGVLSTVAA